MKGGQNVAKKRTISDETIISALLSCPTLEAAAAECGLSVRQLYERRQDPQFAKQLQEAQSAALAGTVRYLQHHTATAAQTLADLCQNAQQEQTRLQAARALLEQAARLTETINFDARLSELEQLQEENNS